MSNNVLEKRQCPECGVTYEATHEYCHNCGEELAAPTDSDAGPASLQQLGAEYYCGECGTEVAAERDSCPTCGTRLV